MDPQTPPRSGIKRSISDSTLFPDEPSQASKITEFDSPRSSRLFQSGEPEYRPSGQETTPVDEPEQDTAEFDSQVNSSILQFTGNEVLQSLSALKMITEKDECLQALTTDSCMTLLHEHPDLRVGLKKAIEMGSYTEIRRLRTWPPSPIRRCFKAQNALN